ncbi:MAG: DegV family protein [Lachnospiraceae bacterium]|jgi:DegV family protein with EDD domain|nr:DegV family protein [Lachnospiraceae bacterium]
MSFKLVIDSCCELPKEYENDARIEFIPFIMDVGERQVVDDESFDQQEFLQWLAECPQCPKSSCPSPERYMQSFDSGGADDIYVITISSKLSGSYNSAMLAKQMYLEKQQKNIHVCDSEAAVAGEGRIALKLLELAEQGLPFAEVAQRLDAFRDEARTYFVLDNLETLRKNGRLTGVKALVASTLCIKPVMGADKGTIIQKCQAIGIKKALAKMVDIVIKERPDALVERLLIAHCNCLERAQEVKKLLEEKANYKEIVIVSCKGLSTMYANDGGVVIGV